MVGEGDGVGGGVVVGDGGPVHQDEIGGNGEEFVPFWVHKGQPGEPVHHGEGKDEDVIDNGDWYDNGFKRHP